MPRSCDKIPEEFEIKQIHRNCDQGERNDLNSGSLVFKISKRGCKGVCKENNISETVKVSGGYASEDEMQSTLETPEMESTDTALFSIDNDIITDARKRPVTKKSDESSGRKCMRKIKIPQSVLDFAEKKEPEQRRTSRRIIVRVNKDLHNLPGSLKTERRRAGRKAVLPGPPKMNKEEQKHVRETVRRGPGRPRKVDSGLKLQKIDKELLSFKDPKLAMAVPKQTKVSAVWTLVPKEMIDSEYFKSHIIKMRYPNPQCRTSCKSTIQVIPRMPLLNRGNIDLQRKHMLQDPYQTSPTKPTVVYVKVQNKYSNYVPERKSVPLHTPELRSMPTFHSKQLTDKAYLHKKYGDIFNESTLECVYGVAHYNLQKTESLLKDILSGRNEPITECETHHQSTNGLINRLDAEQESESECECDLDDQLEIGQSILQGFSPNREKDTLCRQVIVDSINMLYDAESVLGYT